MYRSLYNIESSASPKSHSFYAEKFQKNKHKAILQNEEHANSLSQIDFLCREDVKVDEIKK